MPLVAVPRFVIKSLTISALLCAASLPASFAAEPERAAAPPPEVKSPLDPAEAVKHFQLADASLKIELAAAEPEVIDPVAIRFDEDGRMWVAEMRDYPLGPPPGSKAHSRIRILEDADGDGRFEKATTFADHLSFVTGLQPWKGGAFVTLSGAVVYMKDTDGDGRSDVDETWFEGFAEQNTQLRANHPRLALDNWIYVANGLRGGKVVSRKQSDQKPIDISGMDFRFDPLTGKAEAVSGNGQFGLCFDDWGNRFTCSNRNPCRHVVIEDRYLKANPGVTVPAVMHDVAAFAENSRIFPISRAWTTSNLHAGQFTAACGVYIYRGDLLPAEFKGNVFTCDPTGNLIHREIMQPAGPTFTSKPAYEGKEFLASPDEWFRPVNMELGPDGALYIVDMYRCVIEHPDFVPDELKQRPDQRLGDDRGRIWRIVPAGTNPKRERGPADTSPQRQPGVSPALSKASNDDLLALLGHANAWQRETAQRLLLERERRALAPKLREVSAAASERQARARALWLLRGLELIDSPDIRTAFSDDAPEVRRQALLLAEATNVIKAELQNIRPLLGDSDPTVRFQALLTLAPSAYISGDEGLFPKPLAITLEDIENPWQRQALLMFSGPTRAAGLINPWIEARTGDRSPSDKELEFLEDVGELSLVPSADDRIRVGFSPIEYAIQSVDGQNQPDVGLALLTGMARRWRRGQGIPTLPASRLAEIAKTSEFSMQMRTQAAALLGFVPNNADFVLPLIERDREQSIRTAALGALAPQPGAQHWQPLLDDFPSELPPVRRAIVDGLLANTERTKLLLDAIEAGSIEPSELDAAHVTRLSQHRDGMIKSRAAKIFAAATPAERAKALADYQPVLAMPADPKRGLAIFEKNCAACHKVAGVGVNIAPDISDTRTKKLDQLLGDILLPNRAIDNNYVGYNVRLLDGTVATGILAAETSTSITLRQQGGKEAVIARSDIEELKSSGQSLMPEGLERQIPHQEMADLLSFLKNWRYLDGRTPLQ